MSRVFRPLAADHPVVTGARKCAYCQQVFRAGDRTTIANPVPAGTDNAARALAGRAHTAEGQHAEACADAAEAAGAGMRS